MKRFALLALCALSAALVTLPSVSQDQPYGLEKRPPWTTSKVIGSPEPPLPFSVEKIYAKIKWVAPLYLAAEPGADTLLLVQQGGEKDRPTKILRVSDHFDAEQAEPFLQITNRLVYSLTFDPGYQTNGFLYVFSNGTTGRDERTNHISRFKVERKPPYGCDPASEDVLIAWRSAGHDGGGMVFDRHGYFYISTGDGTSDSDGWVTGQDLSDLNGGILRIRLNPPGSKEPYSVPSDNPFNSYKNARPELWAYGLRNPWRLTIDEKTDQIWAGNNGQDLWETAHLIRRGENYGWSVYEGSHPFYANRQRGPTPPVLPTIEHYHSEMRSLTGGIVYYGEQFPELNGAYLYGDYSTGKILGARHNGEKLTWNEALAQTQLQISSFCQDHHGNILITDHGGALYRIVRAPKEKSRPPFPKRLSETGIFSDVKKLQPSPGVVSYSVKAPSWADGASITRWVGLPGEAQIDSHGENGWTFPPESVLVQTLSLGDQLKHVETRLLTLQNGQWAGYSYRWNPEQTDAELIPAEGFSEEVQIANKKQPWRYPSRAECLACHSRAANFVLSINSAQLDRDHSYEKARDNQLRAWAHAEIFKSKPPQPGESRRQLADPYDQRAELEARARSYLHVNCSVCHVEAGGGNAKMELGIRTARDRMNVIEARPQHDTFGIQNAMLIAPGAPERSIIYQRLTRRGPGQMPPLVLNQTDQEALRLFKEWISQLPAQQKFVREWKLPDLLPALQNLDQADGGKGQEVFKLAGCAQCHRVRGEGGSVGPDLTDVTKRLSKQALLESIVEPSKTIAEGYASTEIETASGESFVGRVENEDAQTITLRPLSDAQQMFTIQKSAISKRALSKLSNMPEGILNTLTEEQIVNLLAFLSR